MWIIIREWRVGTYYRNLRIFFYSLAGKNLRRTTQNEIKKIIGAKYIESMVVADKSVVDFHGKGRAERYIMALMNIVCDEYIQYDSI